MAQFKDLPPELVHEVTKHLAPRRCEDLKHDILSFRAVERRTWLIANQHAFKYMTFYPSDPNDESSLGLFARLSKPDSGGCNIRDMVQEVYVVAARQLGPRVYDENLSESEYRRRAGELFCKMLDKKPTDLTSEEQVAGLNYWKLCRQPFVPQHDIATIQYRLKEDLAKLPHLRSVYADAVEDVLDTKSGAWKTLTKLGLEDKIWNKDRRRFHSIDDEADAARDRIGYYTLGDFGMLLVGAIPPSVSRLKWTSCFDWFVVEDYQRPLLEQIIEFNASLSPMSDRYLDEPDKSMISSFPRLEVLQLTSACPNFSAHS